MESTPKRKLSLITFEEKVINQGSKTSHKLGFSYEKYARVLDFLKPYIEKKSNELYPFQLPLQKNDENSSQTIVQGECFIPLEYIEGRFLDDIKKIAFTTFQAIFFQLSKAIFMLHKNKILARCISSKNIFVNQLDEKIFLLEFGFYPTAYFEQQYQTNIDITLIITIMKELSKKEKCDGIDKINQLIIKLDELERAMPNLNIMESYQRLYELVQNGPTKQDVQGLYTQQWVNELNEKIKQFDFQSLIKARKGDPDDTDDEHNPQDLSWILNRFDFLKQTVEMFKQSFPEEYVQIGLMLSLMTYFVQESNTGNENELNEEIDMIKNKIKQIQTIQDIEKEILDFIKPQLYKQNRLKDFLKYYRYQTYKNYKRLLSSSQNSLKNVKLSFMMIASFSIDNFDENQIQFSKLYSSSHIKQIQAKTAEIILKFKKQ
ncbi:unnamed protein product [Paramecium sonneborni]|uniref:Protein kinase domain-containing protein n=1 Tax=Paramecium sonneborni TaxID=65129 RepID=A0A8S1R8Y9_9CILI|nr:unnamed protein product [Paramecium sonneborni]